MRQLIIVFAVIFNILFASYTFAQKSQCPTAEQIKQEWSISGIIFVEDTGSEVLVYQAPHQYGTNKKWYVSFSIKNIDVSDAREQASKIITEAFFMGGRKTIGGVYTCIYLTSTGETIYAMEQNSGPLKQGR